MGREAIHEEVGLRMVSLGSGHFPRLPNGARQRETIFIDAPTSLMERLIKCDADPACLPPDDVTVVIAALDVDDKIE